MIEHERIENGVHRSLLLLLRSAGFRIVLALLGALWVLGGSDGAEATPGTLHYPKVAAYEHHSKKFHDLTPAQRDTLLWYDLLLVAERPANVESIRTRRPDIKMYWKWMPQTLPRWNPYNPSWHLADLTKQYAAENDWFLHRTTGDTTVIWGSYHWANWTTACPTGTYLDSYGLTYAEWLANVAIPNMITNWAGTGSDWGPDSETYNGFIFEIMVEGLWHGWLGDTTNVDFDNDGYADSFSELNDEWKIVTDQFVADLRAQLGDDFPIIVNGDAFVPPVDDFQGIKLEDLMRRNYWGFWKDFYETPAGRRGYVYARDNCADSWNQTLCQLFFAPEDTNAATQARWARFGLGFALLGDGYFLYSIERFEYPWYDAPDVDPWFPEYDFYMGDSAAPFEKELYGADTLYTRRFYDADGRLSGLVEVNPYADRWLNGVNPRDARFTLYYPTGVEVIDGGPAAPAIRFARPPATPFVSSTSFAFDLPAGGPVQVRVFDVRGRLIETLLDCSLPTGRHTVAWKGDAPRASAPGVYFLRVDHGDERITARVVRLD